MNLLSISETSPCGVRQTMYTLSLHRFREDCPAHPISFSFRCTGFNGKFQPPSVTTFFREQLQALRKTDCPGARSSIVPPDIWTQNRESGSRSTRSHNRRPASGEKDSRLASHTAAHAWDKETENAQNMGTPPARAPFPVQLMRMGRYLSDHSRHSPAIRNVG